MNQTLLRTELAESTDFEAASAYMRMILPRLERSQGEIALFAISLIPASDAGLGNVWPLQPRAGTMQRIRSCLRNGDYLAMIDKDVFLVVLQFEGPVQTIAEIARRIGTALARPVLVNGRSIRADYAIGVTTSRDDLLDADRLLTNAKRALARAKSEAGSQIHYFSASAREMIERHFQVSAELRQAVEDDEIVAFFQPQIDLGSGAIAGFEALARWRHPSKGILAPAAFIDIAETTGLIEKIGEAMLVQSLEAIRHWDRMGFHIPRIAVNLSPYQLRNPCLVEKLRWEIDRCNVDPNRIAVEILESTLVDANDSVLIRNVQGLAAIGILIDLDDFGTGSTSVVNILRFGVNRIKIDRTFVADIPKRPDHRRIVGAMVTLAKALDLVVLAEGVETRQEQDILRDLGCQQLQGYSLARPMPLEQSTGWIGQYLTHGKPA